MFRYIRKIFQNVWREYSGKMRVYIFSYKKNHTTEIYNEYEAVTKKLYDPL